MKKYIYLCSMMLLCLNMMAQIDPYDRNWDTIVFDHFDEPNRQFDTSFQEPLGKWISFVPCLWPSGVTKWGRNQFGNVVCDHQIYQWCHCVFDAANSVLRLNSNFIRDTPILCDEQLDYYRLAPRDLYNISYHCDDNHKALYYYSGMIESPPQDTSVSGQKTKNLPPPRFRFGYFEIRCKLPIHEGAFPAFWLWDVDSANPEDKYYEEIDIFEFSWSFEDSISNHHHNPHPHGQGNPYCFTTGIYYNDTTSQNIWQNSRARNFPMINDSLSHWHTYACEWLPERVIWYCDGNIVNEYYNPDSIPKHHLALKANYAIDRYAMDGHSNENSPHWRGSDTMIIDYINVYQLIWDCDTDETIARQTDLEQFDYGVKKSIAITSSIEPVNIGSTDNVTFRATDSFVITGPFQTDAGGKLTVIIQECPE